MLSEKVYQEMKRLIAEHESKGVVTEPKEEQPYIQGKIVINYKYNPKYGDNKKCTCGHSYDRHFDSYENMEAVGCKYCGCYEFKEA